MVNKIKNYLYFGVIAVVAVLTILSLPQLNKSIQQDASAASCICGDGLLVTDCGEQCDDSNTVDGDGCSSACQLEICGDGVKTPNEECDDGNTTPGDGCSADCKDELHGCYSYLSGWKITTDELCSSGCVKNGWASGYLLENNWCMCFQGTPEQCNIACSSAPSTYLCGYMNCGDGIVDSGEECDETSSLCDEFCQRVPVCGDGFIDSPEQCDDSNTANGDGCDSSCQAEGTLYEHAAGDPIENCDAIDGNVCLWRNSVDSHVNNTVGNDDPYSEKFDTGALKWYDGNCSNGSLTTYTFLKDLLRSNSIYIAYAKPLNLIASLFINDVFAATTNYDPSGNYTCLHTLGSDKYYNVYWLSYGNGKNGGGDSFSYVRNEFTPTCGNGVKEVSELCDDGNTTPGDGCDSSCMIEGTYFEKISGDTDMNNCDPVDPTVCLWRDSSSYPVNNKIGNDTKFNSYVDLGTHKWACGECKDGNTQYTSTLNNLIGACYDKLNNIIGKNTCLYIEDTGAYYDILWLEWGDGRTTGDGFKYVRNPYTSAQCGNGTQEAGEFCDDGNVLGGDGCSPKCEVEGSLFFRNPGDGTDVDVINTGVIQIGRATSGAVPVNTFDGDPVNSTTIEWVCGQCSEGGTFTPHFSSLGNCDGTSLLGRFTCLHDRISNIYWDINWLSYGQWTPTGTNMNEFSYLRSLYDTSAPDTVASTWAGLSSTALTMTWQTPSDNGGGKVKGYKIKYADSEICDETAWNNATKIQNTIIPPLGGGGQSFQTYNSLGFGTFYFSVRAFDQAGNLGDINAGTCGTFSATLSQASLPVLTSVSPNSVVNDADTPVILTGRNFSTKKNKVHLRIGTYQHVIYSSSSTATVVDIIVPAGMSPGVYDVSVYGVDDFSNVLKGALTITEPVVSVTPVVEAVRPSLVVNNVDTDVMLKGKNFIDTATVQLCSNESGSCSAALAHTIDDDNHITFTVPGGTSTGTYYAIVTVSGGEHNVFSPKIKVVAPQAVDGSETDTVNTTTVLDLSGYGAGETKLAVDIKLYDTTIQYINDDLSAGNINVNLPKDAIITGEAGGQYTGELLPPRVVTDKDEIFDDTSAVYGKIKDDSVVILMGSTTETINLDHNFVITLDVISDAAVAPIIWYYNISEDKLELAGKDGVLDGVTYTAGGTVLSHIGGVYTMGILTDHMSAYVAGVAPTISYLSPSSGPVGTVIEVIGTNFHPDATVTVGGTCCPSQIYNSLTSISVAVPGLSAGSTSVVVENPDLLNATSSFTVTVQAAEEDEEIIITTGGGGLGSGIAIVTSPSLLGPASDSDTQTSSVPSTLREVAEGDKVISRPLKIKADLITTVNGTQTAQLTDEDATLTIKPNKYSTISLEIPESTSVEGTSEWDGVISPPLIRSSKFVISRTGDSVEGTDELLTRGRVGSVIEVGSTKSTLIFTNPVILEVLVTWTNGTLVDIYKKPSEGGEWKYINTIVVKNNKATFPTNSLSYFAIATAEKERRLKLAAPQIEVAPIERPAERILATAKSVFRDIQNHWADAYITRLYNENIVAGKGERIFAPNDPVTRAELVKISLKTFNYKIPAIRITTRPFPDVDLNAWYAIYAEVARREGILTGFPDGMRPNEAITRAEALKILLTASKLPLILTTDKNFTDTNPDAWYMWYVRYAYEKGIVSGYADGSFHPADIVTRAEVAKMTVKLLDLYLNQ